MTKEIMDLDVYKAKAEAEAILRLYINDPEIQRQIKENINPITIKGKVVVAKKKDAETFHWMFIHEKPDFIPVFFDQKTSLLKKVD